MGLNETGSFVFESMDGTRTVQALAEAVAERFGVTASQARADVASFLGVLASRGLVEDGRS